MLNFSLLHISRREVQRLITVLVMCLCFMGCTSKLVYNNLDWWVYWYLDDYIELNDVQEARFDEHLNAWLRWHKTSELRQYKAQLELLKQQIITGTLDYKTISEHFEAGKGHWNRVKQVVSPTLAELAQTLSNEQVVTLFAKLEQDNQEERQKRARYLAKSIDEQREERIDSLTDSIESRIGKLTTEQQQIITTYSDQFISTRSYWIQYQQDILNAARRLFATRNTNEHFVEDLTALLSNPEQYRSDDYLRKSEENTKVMITLMSEIASTLTSKQRRYIIKNIDNLIDDVESLMK